MSHLLLDTDVWSFLFKGDTRAENFRSHLVGNTPCIAFATVAELYLWAELHNWGSRRQESLRQAMAGHLILSYDDATGRQWARIRAERQRLGKPMASQDAWIAACAIRHGMALLTHNSAHFENITGLSLLTA